VAHQMNRKRELHGKLDSLLDSNQAELAGSIVDLLYKKTTMVGS